MTGIARPLTRAIIIAAMAGAFIAWAVATIVFAVNQQRAEARVLGIVSSMMRRTLADADDATITARLPQIETRLDGVNLEATYVRQSPPPAALTPGRMMWIVPTRNGYIALSKTSSAKWATRVAWFLALLAGLAVAGGIAALAGGRWAQERAGSIAQGDERLRAFLADAAHELRTPLAIAVGYTGILKRGGSSDRELTDRIVGDISAEHDRLQRLVERILQLARLDAVGSDRRGSSDAVRIAQETIALVRPLDPDRTIELEAPPSARVAIGEDDLRDALRNLLDNALRYAPGAPITVRIVSNGDTFVRVSDRGPGMDAFTAEHAFDRFFRGEDRGSIPGSGLGLSIVRRIVERAGGRVTLDSSENGTTVEIRLRPMR